MTDALTTFLTLLFQILLVLAVAPLLNGVMKRTKARLQHRKGPGFTQPYADLEKLLKKEVIVSDTTSWIFRATPAIGFGSVLAIALLVPTAFSPVPLHGMGDMIMVIGLFALGRFFLALAALDAGSAFGGLGSSREMSLASIIEPAMMLAIFTVAVTAGSTNLSIIVERLTTTPSSTLNPAHLLAFAGLFIATLAETGRIPVDNPATHLELTMIHEAMILEYSGRYLAFIEWGSQVKMLLFLSLLANMFFPAGLATSITPWPLVLGVAAFVAKIAVLGVMVAVVESVNAKLRLFRVPEFLMVALFLSLLALILYFIVGA